MPLPFVHAADYAAADFLHGAGSDAVFAWLDRPEGWPEGRLAIWGEAGSGKTHLLHVWAGRVGASLVDGPSLAWPRPPPTGPLGIDDADAADADSLLHALNAAREARVELVLASRLPPARWNVALPDLASRLRATAEVELRAAEDELLAPLFARLLAGRQLAVPAPVQAWLLLRLPRSPAALERAAAALDRALMASGGRISRGLAASVLDTAA